MPGPKLKVTVNKNPTKEGVKVQFILTEQLEGDAKAKLQQKLQTKLNAGLAKYNLTSQLDTDVPYPNIIGFLIPIMDFRLMIKNVLSGGVSEQPPTPELPI